MARRMIDDSMWANESFAEMPMGARLLTIGIINHADDQGRMKANPAYLRAQIFPYDDIATPQIQEWLEIIQVNETLILYTVNGKQFLQLTNWWKYQSLQYAQPSQFPRPAGWKDRIRRTLTKGLIVTYNWQKVNGEPIEDSCDQDGNPTSTPAKTPGDSPEHSGNHPPECSGEDTIELNLTKLNIKEDAERARTAPARTRVSNTPVKSAPSAPQPTAMPERKNGKVTHYDPRQVDKGGLLPKGAGTTQIEIWKESFAWTPTSAQIRDMNERVTDLDKWRQVTAECAIKAFRSYSNVIDVYLHGWREPPDTPAKRTVSGDIGINLTSI